MKKDTLIEEIRGLLSYIILLSTSLLGLLGWFWNLNSVRLSDFIIFGVLIVLIIPSIVYLHLSREEKLKELEVTGDSD